MATNYHFYNIFEKKRDERLAEKLQMCIRDSLVHSMRTRIMTSPAFTSEHILAAILFEKTMEREVEGKLTADYLWEEKHILPILKVDKGLALVENGVQCMKPIPGLDELLVRAKERHIFGTRCV